jgi:hypothetical protein
VAEAESRDPKSGVIRRSGRWLFLNRLTGRVTVAQWPNSSLTVFIVLSIALRFLPPNGGSEDVLRVVADVALFVWAADELIRGVNPFRRILGLVVIGVTIASLIL